jgi:hypothetical protein
VFIADYFPCPVAEVPGVNIFRQAIENNADIDAGRMNPLSVGSQSVDAIVFALL